MAMRNIIDWQGNTIGSMSQPDETTEAEWAAVLAPYAIPPNNLPMADVSPRQIRIALVLSGISLSSIDDALKTFPQPQQELAFIAWQHSTIFIRDGALVKQVGQMLGWGKSQLDALWTLAATL